MKLFEAARLAPSTKGQGGLLKQRMRLDTAAALASMAFVAAIVFGMI